MHPNIGIPLPVRFVQQVARRLSGFVRVAKRPLPDVVELVSPSVVTLKPGLLAGEGDEVAF
jgi:hypothetical protein